MQEFDYVIVGAGTAGCVLAARLSEDGARVLLLEAGGSHKTLKVRAPGMYFALWRTRHDWAFSTEPQTAADGRRVFIPRGKVLGGSGSLNASLYVRGHRGDYDGWRDAGCAGWGWDDLRPLFERSLQTLAVEDQPAPCDAAAAFVEALSARCQVARVDDFNGGESEGAGFYKQFCRRGERWSTARAYLDPARARANLTVVTGALALGLVAGESRITGVRYRVGNRDEVATARREVIVCGGAIGSPHLLLLSGIGPAAHLKEMGVPVVHDLPAVGQNLQDHLVYFVYWEAKRGTVPPLTRGALFRSLAQWMIARSGRFARTPVQAGGFVRTRPGLARPDLQFHFIPAAPFEPNFDEPRELGFGSYMMVFPTLIYPRSRGEIRLRSKDPAAPPAIDPRFLSDPADVEALVAGIALTREIGEHDAMRRVRGAELRPGPSVVDPDALRASVRRHTDTVFHPVGTCAMGTVVDSALRVRGLDGLRVADASVMPTITGGNTNAPVIAIAEKAADLIRSA